MESSLIKEAVAQAAKIQVPILEVQPSVVLAASIPAKEKKKADSETKVASSKPSSARKSEKGKKKQEPLTELEEEEESIAVTGSSEGGTELEDEEVLATLSAKKRRSMNTRSSDKKALPSVYKTPLASKRQAKTSLKGGSSQKRSKGK